MPARQSAASTISRSKVERAQRVLAGAGVSREDSDDELGLDDHPWQWIRSKGKGNGQGSITGARMGSFQCMVGDCVLLKAECSNEAWVGLICDFQEEEEGEKTANFMWFSTEKEIMNKEKKRKDFLPSELYITPSWDINPLTSINGKAQVISLEAFRSKYPSGKVPRSSKDYGKIFLCRRGCNTRTAKYTEEFKWEDIYRGEDDLGDLIEMIRTQTKATRKRKREKPSEDDNVEWEAGVENEEAPKTPSKKRKLQPATTPTSKTSARAERKFTTPTNKRIIIKKPLEFTPLGTRIIFPSHIASSPFQIARTRLHVSAVPNSLPCREEAFATVYSHLEAAISDGSGSCIYISGTPGTGKTATVREVVAQLNSAVLADELDDFIFVEINGMKVTDPHQSYSLLWEALRGDRVSPSHALDLLEREFSHPNPRRVPCVVLMDELDQLVTKNQSVMYNFFNWPSLRHSRLIVLAVANTMDLPERTLSNKISSRLGLTRITFPGYSHDQLMLIIQSRLEGVPGNIVDPDAVQFASRKVAAVSGDARRALDICRRAVEIAETESLAAQDPLLATPSKRHREKESRLNGPEQRLGRVTISTIKQAINEATSSPLAQSLRSLPLACKLFLAALLARTRRTGVSEALLGDILDEAKRMGQMATSSFTDQFAIRDYLMSVDRPQGQSAGGRVARAAVGGRQKIMAARVEGMGHAAMELAEAGIVGVEGRRGERGGRVRLIVWEEDIRGALRDDGEGRELGFAA